MRRPTSGPRYCGGKRTELKVTEAQASAWNACADALRTNAQKLGEVPATMMAQHAGQQQASTLADRLEPPDHRRLQQVTANSTSSPDVRHSPTGASGGAVVAPVDAIAVPVGELVDRVARKRA